MRTYRDSIILRASRLINEDYDPNNYLQNSPVDPTANTEEEIDDTTLNDDAEQTYDVDVANPVCPCCGARLNIVDNSDDETAEEDGIEAMDPTLEPQQSEDNDDTYVTIGDLDDDEEEEEDDEETPEEDSDEDSDEEYGEKIEAF